MLTSIFLVFGAALVGAAIVFFIVLFVQRAHKKMLSTAFGLELFTVSVPKDIFSQLMGQQQQKQSTQQFKELIGRMEQLYSGMSLLGSKAFRHIFYGKPYLVFELAVPHIGEEIIFYSAIPRKFKETFEKQVSALFPGAVVSKTEDYNIFNEKGGSVAAVVRLRRTPLIPLLTYTELASDPLEVLTNTFSKIKEVGEGASFQLVFRPGGKYIRKKAEKFIKLLKEGKSQEHALEKLSHDPIFQALDFAKSEQVKEKEKASSVVVEDSLIKRLEEKLQKPLLEVNIRLVASAPTNEEAEALLQSMTASLSQFGGLRSNSFTMRILKGRALRRCIFNFAFRIFEKREIMVLSSEELAGIFHFPISDIQSSRVKFVKSREASAPANMPHEGLILGKNVFRGIEKEVRVQKDDRRRHLYTIGQTGTGKTTMMKGMIAQDIEAGEGLAVIDPHGDLIDDILGAIPRERADDVIVFNPGDIQRPLGMNILEIDPDQPQQKSFVMDDFYKILRMIYKDIPEAFGPIFEKFFKNTVMLLLDDYKTEIPTIAEISRVFSDKAYRDDKLSRETNPEIVRFWRFEAEKMAGEWSLPNMSGYITSKFSPFLINEYVRPIITQQKSAFKFREVMDNKKILLVNLSKGLIGDINANLLGMIIVSKILVSAFSRVDTPQDERQDFYLYIDEFQNFTTDSIASILSEARKYRLDLIIAHQYIKQLQENIRDAVFGNVGSMVSFRVGADDAEFLKNQFDPIFTPHDLMNIDNFNAYVKLLINNQTSQPFNMQTFPGPKGDLETARFITELSRMKYGRDRELVESEFRARQGMETF